MNLIDNKTQMNKIINFFKIKDNIPKCDVLYISGTFDYNESISGNYIIYKILKKCDFNLKVLPLFKSTKQVIDNKDLLPYKLGIKKIPEHKILVISGNDIAPNILENICKKYNSTLVCIAMTHWMYGNTSQYPELDDDFQGPNVNSRLNLYNSVKSYIITASSYSTSIHKLSNFSHIPVVQIPFPFEEIESVANFKRSSTDKKVILWGTTQPETLRKGKKQFEEILDNLFKIVEHPDDILIRTIGPKSEIKTKFKVEYLDSIPNRLTLSTIYKNSDVFALTTLADAGPMMATECIKNGTPLVSFRTNISIDFIDKGKNGFIVEQNYDFANKIFEILYKKNVHIDLEYVKNFNSEDVVYQKYDSFFKKILREYKN